MSKQEQPPKPAPMKAVSNSKGEVEIYDVSRVGNIWCFACTTKSGRPVRLRAQKKYWKSDIGQILAAWKHLMPEKLAWINPKLAPHVSRNEYLSAQAWHREHGKELPKVILYGRYAELVKNALANKEALQLPEEFDQDYLSDLLLSSSSSQIELDGDDAEETSDALQNSKTAAERAGLVDTDSEELEKNAVATDGVAEFDDYLPTSNTEPEGRNELETITPVQRLVRSSIGNYLEQYFMFQDGMTCKEIAPKFRKIRKPKLGSPKGWPQVAPCTPGDIRRAVEYVTRWVATLPNKASVLAAARAELERVNKDAAWSELARRLHTPDSYVSEPPVDPSKKRGREWATIDSLRNFSSGGPEYFDYYRYVQRLFDRPSKKRESEEIPRNASVSCPQQIEGFLNNLAAKVGVSRSAVIPKRSIQKAVSELEPTPPVFRIKPMPPAVPYERPNTSNQEGAETAEDRKRKKSRQIEAGLLVIIDGGKPISFETKAKFVAVADGIKRGDSISTIANKLKTNPTEISRLIAKLKKGAA